MTKKLTCRDEILMAVKKIIEEKGKNEFTSKEVIDILQNQHTHYKDSTIQTHISSKCCMNSPNHHQTVYNDFERIGTGLYKLLS
jgi:hypothetical protein